MLAGSGKFRGKRGRGIRGCPRYGSNKCACVGGAAAREMFSFLSLYELIEFDGTIAESESTYTLNQFNCVFRKKNLDLCWSDELYRELDGERSLLVTQDQKVSAS